MPILITKLVVKLQAREILKKNSGVQVFVKLVQ